MQYILFSSWFLPAIQLSAVLVIGCMASFTDLRSGVIRNVHVAILALVGGSIAFVEALGSGLFDWWLAGALMSLALPLILWLRSMVSAGDAKLLMAMGIALPSWGYPSLAPSLFPFSIVLLAAFLILVAQLALKSRSSGAVHHPLSAHGWSAGFFDRALLSSVIVPSWLFLLAWRSWISWSDRGSGEVFMGVAVALMVLPFALQGFFANLRLPLWGSISLMGIVAGLCVHAGSSVGSLAVVAISAVLIVLVAGLARRRLLAMCAIDDNCEEGHGGDIRFAHALLLAVILVGVVRLAEVWLAGSFWELLKSSLSAIGGAR